MLETAALLRAKNAGKIFICSTFGIFTNGIRRFNEAYEKGLFDRLITTNLVYTPPELFETPYYTCCDMSKFLALIIDTMNHNVAVTKVITPTGRLQDLVARNLKQKD